VGGYPLAAEAVGLEADDFANWDDALPGFDGVVAPGVCGDSPVEEIDDALVVELAGWAVESRIAGEDVYKRQFLE